MSYQIKQDLVTAVRIIYENRGSVYEVSEASTYEGNLGVESMVGLLVSLLTNLGYEDYDIYPTLERAYKGWLEIKGEL